MRSREPSILRRSTGIVVALFLALGYFSPMQQTLRSMPDTITLTQGRSQTFTLGSGLTLHDPNGTVAVASSSDETLKAKGTVEITGSQEGSAQVWLSLLGVPLKKVEVQISPEKRLIPGGQAIGVALHTDGVLVVGVSALQGGASPAEASGIRAGDVLRRVNGVSIDSAQQLAELIAAAGERPLPVEYARDGAVMTTTLTPGLDSASGTFRMGAWVRDSTAGVGTLSFYDPENGGYAALGHAITDGDTGKILTVGQGKILRASVVDVQKGQKGAPGELKGSFLREAVVLGDIRRNNSLGIYGHMDEPAVNPLYPDGLPVGRKSEVHTGAAQILSTVDASGMKAYDVEIVQVNQQSAPAPKSMVIRVTDPALLAITGGIVQGMSGSPIIQDGKLVGAVTHVLVNDPTRGYGIFIENMLEAAG